MLSSSLANLVSYIKNRRVTIMSKALIELDEIKFVVGELHKIAPDIPKDKLVCVFECSLTYTVLRLRYSFKRLVKAFKDAFNIRSNI